MMAAPVTAGRTLGDLLGARAGVHAQLPISDIALNSSAVQPGRRSSRSVMIATMYGWEIV